MEPHSLVGGTGESGSVRLGPGLRPLKPTPHGPPTGSGGREKWFIGGRKKWKIERLLSAFSQRVPTHVPRPPSRWAGRYGPFTVRAAGQVFHKKYSLPPHNPTREGSPEGRTSSLWGFFPPFLPKKWGPGWASQGSLPFQRRRRNPATRPARSNGAGAKHKKPAAPVPGNRWFSLRSGLSHSAKLCTDPCRQSMETFIPSCRVRVAPMAPTMTALFRLRPTTAAWLPSPFSSVMIPAACRR